MLNADHEPLEGMFPIANLKRGTWLRDRVRVKIPGDWPAGPLHVDIGLWKRAERLPARGPHSAGDAVRCASMKVVP
jgi:hypothetical protein